jgi:putative redox protein
VPKVIARRRKGFTHQVEMEGGHTLVSDEPESAGGADEGPSPTRLLAASLAACTAITIEMYAERKQWQLDELEVEVDMEYGKPSTPKSFDVILRLPKGLSEEQTARLRAIAGHCPVHRALKHEIDVTVVDRVEIV